mgnify:CR=1 FL=1
MEDQTLLKLALIVSMTGILLLIFVSDIVEVKEYKITDLTRKDIEKDVKIRGKVTRVTETPGLLIFNIRDETGEVTAILFKEDPINITENQRLEIEGKVKEYKDKLEIEVSELKTIEN